MSFMHPTQYAFITKFNISANFQYWINFPIFKMADPMFIFNSNKMGGNLDSNKGDKVMLNGEDEDNELQYEDAKLESIRKYDS